MPTDTSEQGLEIRICNLLQESGWLQGDNQDYNAASCVDLAHLAAFLQDTQPETAQALHLDQNDNTRRQFLRRLHRQIGDRGIIDVLRNGIEHGQHSIRLFYGTPSPGNEAAATLHAKNRFSVTRQVHYSTRNPGLSLDLVLFINGLPLITFELKNNLTKQTVEDAVEQYRTSRDPRDDLFRPGRCAAHMAVDENRVRFCTELAGLKSVFLPFDQGHDGGAGNPPNPQGLRTDYLWQETLTPESLTDIIENYVQKVRRRSKPSWRRPTGRKPGKRFKTLPAVPTAAGSASNPRDRQPPVPFSVRRACARSRNSDGNPDSPQAVVFLTSIIDVIVGY